FDGSSALDDPNQHYSDGQQTPNKRSSRVKSCPPLAGCGKRFHAVILSGAKNLALRIFTSIPDSSSSANKNGGLLRMTAPTSFSAACYDLVACSAASRDRSATGEQVP